jgi:DNA-directed RNA polymerase specialized sigma24 family protein
VNSVDRGPCVTSASGPFAITLRDIEGMTAGEVCDLLDLTPANERVLLHRARARVRRGLEDYLKGVEA